MKSPRASTLTKIAAFFNSAIGLWLLSALFISFGAKKYEDYKAKQADEKGTNERIEKLNLEISYRYCRILIQLYLLTDRKPKNEKLATGLSVDDVKKVAFLLKQSNGTGDIYLYPEYSNWGMAGLMGERRRNLLHLGKSDDKLDDVLMHVTGLEVFFEVRRIDFSDVRKVAGAIEDELILPQWKTNQFYFFEGGAGSPFP